MKRMTVFILAAVLMLGAGHMAAAKPPADTHSCGGVHGKSNLKTIQHPTTGNVVGITIVVDFPEYENTNNPTDMVDINNYLNEVGYTGHDNNGSVHDYFYDVSCGALNYTNTVPTAQFVAPETRDYYASHPFSAAGDLATAAIQWLDGEGFDFSNYDSNGDGYVDAINILVEGGLVGNSALHPHFSQEISVPVDGVIAGYYQLSVIGNVLKLGVFCHENGHMLCGWGDLYDSPYSNSEWGAVGSLCLMRSSFAGNPVEPNGYFKMLAGWATPTQLGYDPLSPFSQPDQLVRTNAAACEIFKVSHPSLNRPGEFYILENRFEAGRDVLTHQSGLAIYHIDETQFDHPVIELVQADGNDEVDDFTNVWASPDADHFDFSTTPRAIWYDGTSCSLNVHDIGSPGQMMTFWFEDHPMATANIYSKPSSIEASWTLEGPGDYMVEGSGATLIDLPAIGSYTVAFHDYPYWAPPQPASITRDLRVAGSTVTFASSYVSPIALTEKGDLGDANNGTTVCIIDYDGDGHQDLFIGNTTGRNQILLSDNRGGFGRNIAPPILADAGAVHHAAWADMDNDGDLDVFLVRNDGEHMLLERNFMGLTDVTADTPEFVALTEVTSAAWSDVDRDGNLDLFLTRRDSPNELYLGDGSGAFAPEYAAFAAGGNDAAGTSWGDYNADGYSDFLICANGGDPTSFSRLIKNNGGVPAWAGPYQVSAVRDARWADFTNDGLIDLAMLNGYGSLVFMIQEPSGSFSFMTSCCNVGATGVSITAADFDNDGDVDIYIAHDGADDELYMNEDEINPGGTYVDPFLMFTSVSTGHTQTTGACVAVASLDTNNDGAMDVMVIRDGEPNFLLVNKLPNRGNWLKVNLDSTGQNRGAVGARVEIHVGDLVLQREVTGGGTPGQDSSELHFGVGDASVIDLIMVWWGGDSTPTVMTAVSANQTLNITDSPDKDPEATPTFTTELQGSYPNPFNPSTSISFSLAGKGHVKAAVYGIDGRLVNLLQNDVMPAGQHDLIWNGVDDGGQRVASGCYFFRIDTGSQVMTTKLTLVK